MVRVWDLRNHGLIQTLSSEGEAEGWLGVLLAG